MADQVDKVQRRRSIRKVSQSSYIVSRHARNELRDKMRKVSEILKKPEQERTVQDTVLVKKNPELVTASQKNARILQTKKERILEVEDEPQLLVKKCEKLAELIKSSKNIVVYTGAGISTAASIPDYRGPNGVWTLLKKGQELSAQDLSDAEPTFTHMSLTQLFKVGKVKHIVSQNCDGLHIRSGFPRHAISEVHGNMYIECCYACAPHKEFVRLFDVTERTGVHRHTTSRHCISCGGSLKDTIVHFGEKGKLKSPYRWKEAVRAAKRADLILCLGSSLKVLRKYSCLWCMDKKPQCRPKLVIINLQWTPKDDVATLKISGKCDTVMMNLMTLLDYDVPEYKREKDPIFQLCTALRASERKTTTKKILIPPTCQALKHGIKSRTKGASKSTTPKRSNRLTNSASKDTNSRNQAHLFSKCSYPVESEPADELMEEKKINSNRGNLKEYFLGSSKVYYPAMNLIHLQDRSEVSEDSVFFNSFADSSEDVTDFKLYYISNINSNNSDLTSEPALLAQPLSWTVPQTSFNCQRIPNYALQEFNIQENVPNGLKLVDLSLNVDEDFGSVVGTSLSNQEDSLNYTNQNIPELVVVNLGKDKCICEWEQQKLDNVCSSFSKKNVSDSETVLCVQRWMVDNHKSDLLVTDPKLVLSKQITNVCRNSSPSRSVCSSSHTLNNIPSNNLSGEIIHSFNETEVQVNLNGEYQHLENREPIHRCDRIISFSAEPVFQHCVSLLSSSENFKHDHNVNTRKILKQSQINDLSDDSRKQQNEHMSFPTLQPVSKTIKNICLDHSYSLTETSSFDSQQHSYSLPETLASDSQQIEPFSINNSNAQGVHQQTKCLLSWCPLSDQISHSISSYCTCKQVHTGSCVSVSKSFLLENDESMRNVSSLEIKSSHLSVHTNSGTLGSSMIELNPYTQIVSKEDVWNTPCLFDDKKQGNSIYSNSDVPSCILNMDDMQILCTHSGIQSKVPFDSSTHEDAQIVATMVNGYTDVMETPPKVVFPWNNEVLVMPSDCIQFQSCQDNKLQTFEVGLLSDSCHLELELAHSVYGTVYENGTTCCNESHLNCFVSDTVDPVGLYVDSIVPSSVLFESNIQSLFDLKEQSFGTFKNRTNCVFVESQQQSFPLVNIIPREPSIQTGDTVSKYELRNTFLALQGNMEMTKTDTSDMKRGHKISKLPYVQVNKQGDNKKERHENVCRKVYKRKETVPSIPGWFGKGLIVKKKRK